MTPLLASLARHLLDRTAAVRAILEDEEFRLLVARETTLSLVRSYQAGVFELLERQDCTVGHKVNLILILVDRFEQVVTSYTALVQASYVTSPKGAVQKIYELCSDA